MPIPGQATGREGLHLAVELFRGAMPDLAMTLHGTIACGDIGVDWWTLEGTHQGPLMDYPPTGRKLRFSGIDWVRTEGGLIRDLWHIEEMYQMMDQLAAKPGEATSPPPVDTPAALSPGQKPASPATRLPDMSRLTETEQRHLAVARRHIEALWARGDTDVAAQVYSPDVIDMNPAPGQRPGVAGILDVLSWLRASAPDLSMHIDGYAVDGNFAADRWTMSGTLSGAPLLGHEARGQRFTMKGMDIVRFDTNSQIDRIWHVEDFAALAAQIS
jgi:predicted ester cyclase